MESLRIENVAKSFGGKTIIKDISLTLKKGELVCILGVSGSGKTTLFNIIAGLSEPDCGRVFLENEDVTGKPEKSAICCKRTCFCRISACLTTFLFRL